MHEEGRVAYELGTYQYEYHVKDHLGNVRQVLRNPTTQVFMATMETENAAEEEATFSQLSESRQSGAEHNVTEGGDQVAWLNAGRGRIAGPGRAQPIYAGDSVTLRVHGKYAEPTLTKINAETYLTQSAKDQMVDGISELAGSLQRSGSGNPIALLNLANILAGDLQRKEAPEAYLIYALYDTDSNRYEVGKQVLTKNAANQHEVLEENLYISEDGYIETFVVNETSEDVWFDDFMVMSTTSPVMQETQYSLSRVAQRIGNPWGLELTGIGFQYAGINANKYLYNGIELVDDLNLNVYSAFYRNYDPVIGRWWQIDPKSTERESPYVGMGNNPILYSDYLGDTIRLGGEVGGEFQQQFYEDKAKIEGTEEGRALFKVLDESEADVYISEATTLKHDVLTFFGLEGDTDENNFYSTITNPTGKGGATVEYSQIGGVKVDGVTSESHHTLNHELNHAKDFVTGTTARETKESSPAEAIRKGEIRAVQSTNRIRERESKPSRTQYTFSDGKVLKIPKQ
jgi:RHS repeat-associated protein